MASASQTTMSLAEVKDKRQDESIIDFHVHMGKDIDGEEQTPEQILDMMEKLGIEYSVVFPFNTADSNICFSETNRWIADVCAEHTRLIGFCRVDPKHESCMDEIDRSVEMGLRGIKIHPKYQQFELRDVPHIFEKAAQVELPLILHSAHKDGAHVKYVGEIAPSFPGLNIILAHAGLGDTRGASDVASENPNVFLEISINFRHKIEQMILGAGADKVLFGSDAPYHDVKGMLDKIYAIKWLDQEDRRKILADNAASILGLGDEI